MKIINLSKTFHTKAGVTVCALSHINVALPRTGLVFITGRSGSGKSTLLNAIAGLIKPDEGEIDFEGENPRVSFCFQSKNLISELTVFENIVLPRKTKKEQARAKVDKILASLGLSGFLDRKCYELSGGEQQRVALARALFCDSSLILCDEPTGSLDSKNSETVFNELSKAAKSRLVIVATHDVERAKEYPSSHLRLVDGKVMSFATQTTENSEPLYVETQGRGMNSRVIAKLSLLAFKKHPILSLLPTVLIGATFLSVLFLSSFGIKISDADIAQSVLDSSVQNVVYEQEWDHGFRFRDAENGLVLGFASEEEAPLEEELGTKIVPMYGFPNRFNLCTYSARMDNSEPYLYNAKLNTARINKAIPLTESTLLDLGFKVHAGRVPADASEVAMPLCQYQELANTGCDFSDLYGNTFKASPKEMENPEAFLRMSPRLTVLGQSKKIVGIIDTGFDPLLCQEREDDSLDLFSPAINATSSFAIDNSPHVCLFVAPSFCSALQQNMGQISGFDPAENVFRYGAKARSISTIENTTAIRGAYVFSSVYFSDENDGVCVDEDVLKELYADQTFNVPFYDPSGIDLLDLPRFSEIKTKDTVLGDELFGQRAGEDGWCKNVFAFSSCCAYVKNNWNNKIATSFARTMNQFCQSTPKARQLDYSLPENEDYLKTAAAILWSSENLFAATGVRFGNGGSFSALCQDDIEITGKGIVAEAVKSVLGSQDFAPRNASFELNTYKGRYQFDLPATGYYLSPANADAPNSGLAFDFDSPLLQRLASVMPEARTIRSFVGKTPAKTVLARLAGEYEKQYEERSGVFAQIPQFHLRYFVNRLKVVKDRAAVLWVAFGVAVFAFALQSAFSFLGIRGKIRVAGLLLGLGAKGKDLFVFTSAETLLGNVIGLILGSVAMIFVVPATNAAFTAASGITIPFFTFPTLALLLFGLASVALGILSCLPITWKIKSEGALSLIERDV